MSKRERELSKYIDSLNADKKPNHQDIQGEDRELEELFKTVKAVHSLKEPRLPEGDFSKKLAANLSNRLNEKHRVKTGKRSWVLSTAAVAAVILAVFLFNVILPFSNINIVSAMEKAFEGVKAYHGVLEIIQTNLAGSSSVQSKLEVWADKDGRYYLKQLEGTYKGLVTANNGQQKWQHRPDEKQSYIFPAFPDAYRYVFELGREIDNAKNALETKVIGEETLAGRKTKILEVTPQGGEAYRLWIDEETKLPLQKETAMQNALSYRVTYTEIDLDDSIPVELMAYHLPEGYKEVNEKPEQIVNSFEEASEVTGFMPVLPENVPVGYSLNGIAVEPASKSVKLTYLSDDKARKIVVLESKTDGELKPASHAILGKIGDKTAEIQSPVSEEIGILGVFGPYTAGGDVSSIRWQHNGYAFAVAGDTGLEAIADFVQGFNHGEVRIPADETDKLFNPSVEVPVDLEVERNEQKSVDAGHSPWRLDPVFVAQVFVSLKISPEGIVGDYPIRYEDLKITHNTGSEAIIEVMGDKTPIRKVYLKKLIRQDPTGIWTVVGYDPVSK